MTDRSGIETYAARNNAHPPSRLGRRYDAQRFLPEAGNTVVCHLDTDAPAHRAVIEARARIMALPGADRFLFTPIESLHMTVFEGAIETRRKPDAWPAGVALDAPVETVTQEVLGRLTDFRPEPAFAVRATALRPTGLMLAGATAADETTMQCWRAALTAPFGYRHADHDTYRFHMTFAYPIDWLPDDLLPIWEDKFSAIFSDLVSAAPVIPLKPPAFCRFHDMTRFEELLVLGS